MYIIIKSTTESFGRSDWSLSDGHKQRTCINIHSLKGQGISNTRFGKSWWSPVSFCLLCVNCICLIPCVVTSTSVLTLFTLVYFHVQTVLFSVECRFIFCAVEEIHFRYTSPPPSPPSRVSCKNRTTAILAVALYCDKAKVVLACRKIILFKVWMFSQHLTPLPHPMWFSGLHQDYCRTMPVHTCSLLWRARWLLVTVKDD